MANVMVKVLRQLNGGEYEPGDMREMTKADADRLAATGAVALEDEVKAAAPPENKMATTPLNKAAPKRKVK